MAFCTNCGSPFSSPLRESQIPTLPKVELAPSIQGPPVKGGSKKLWVVGLFGCFGLLAFGLAAILAAGIYSGSFLGNSTNGNKAEKENDPPRDGKGKNDKKAAEAELLDILKDRKEAGRFKQLTAEAVNTKDYFPGAVGAAQASYHNGSRYVAVSIGKFASFDDAKKDFDEQFAAVKKNGGKVQVLPPPSDGTVHGVYQTGGKSYAEYCTKSAFCYRLASADALALKTFIENFITL